MATRRYLQSVLLVLICFIQCLAVRSGAAEVPQTRGKVISKGASPVSETWQQMKHRDEQATARREEQIRRGLRPRHVPKIQPEEENEEEEREKLRPGKEAKSSTPTLAQSRFRVASALGRPGPRLPQALASAGFKGDDMLQGSQVSGFLFIPPDTEGAIGPNHFMELTNATMSVYTRTGTKLTTTSLDSFFTMTVGGTTYPRNGSTDPRILYDRKSGRWFACIIEIGPSTSGAANNILLVVSRTSDPLTTVWDKYVIPTAQGGATGNTKFNDYESMGLDDNGLYFGMTVFPKGGGSHARIVVTPKASLIAASPSLGTVTDFDNITDMYSTPQPGNNFDTVASTGRAWFVSANHQVYANMNYRRLTWSAGTPTLDAASTVLTTPAFTAPIDVPTSGAALNADVGDMRMMMAVIRNDRLWCCRHVAVNSSGGSTSADRTACEFIELNVSSATPTVVQTGRVYDNAASTPRFYFYPSLAISGQGHVLMGMSGAKSNEFIGTYICGRWATDATGVMGAPTLVKAGEAKYSVSFSGSPDRWGDYSFTSLDPNDDMSMWTIQEYARTPNGTQDLWSTWIAKALSAAPTLNNPGASGMQGTTSYTLALTGTGFYDPGAGFPNRLSVSLNGGAVNGISNYAITYNSPSSVTVAFSIAGNASTGLRDIVLTNPDGQTATVVGGFTVTASSPNTAPVITVPGAQTGSEDTNLPISGITVADADAGSGDMLTTLSVSNGTITLGSTIGLTFSSGANGTAGMVFTGTLTNLNTALSGLVYKGALNYNGSDTLNIAVSDQGNSGSGGALSDAKTIAITLSAVNDAPAITAPASASGNEDASFAISGISVSDVDLAASPIQVSLSASNGTLNMSTITGLSFTVGSNGSSSMTFNGSLANINAALASLSYTGASNFNGSDTIVVNANDLGATGSGGAQSASKNIAVTVNAVNDAPVLTAPASASGNEDASITISGISASDVDLGTSPIRAILSASNGVLSLGSVAGLTFTAGANGTSAMTFSGSLANVNTALGGLSYLGNLNYNGSDSVSIQVSDLGGNGSGGALTDSKTVAITVNAVNDAPTAAAPASASGNEDTSITVAGVSVADVDIGSNHMRISLGATTGNLKLAATGGLSFLFGSDNSTTMTFTGTLASVNTALSGFTYSPPPNFNGSDTIILSANDQGSTGTGGALSVTKNIAITVTAVNDAPVLVAPASASGNEDTSFAISGISASDVDLGTSPIRATLSASNGVLNLGSVAGLSFTAGANGTASMTFSGPLANVNTALGGLTYQGNANYNGSDTVNIQVSDLGANGSGGALTDSKTVAITVNAVNDAPGLVVPSSVSGNEDTSITVSGVTVSDVDVGASALRVSIGVTNGVLKLASTTGLTFLFGADNSTTMTFTGTLANVSAALTGFTYSSAINYNGPDTITINVNDQGFTGSGGALSTSGSIPVTVNAVNDAPALSVPGTQSVNEDTTFTLPAISVSDVDLGGGQMQITLTAANGRIALATTTGLSFSAGGNGINTMTFSGTLANVLAALNGITYRGNANYNGPDTISVTANDQGNTGTGGALMNNQSIVINVAAVNDAPVATAPASASGNEDTSFAISGISVADVDIGTSPVQVSLSVTSGSITLGTVTGLTFTSGSNGSAAFTVSGSLANMNTALASLTYLAAANYNGSDTLVLNVSDLGATGIGGALTDSKSVGLTINAVNDAPVLSVPAGQSINEDTTLTLPAISVADVDVLSGQMQITLSCGNGTLTLASTTGLTINSGANGTASITFSGTLSTVLAALNGAKYLASADYNGADLITVSANDQGNTGSGGAKSDSKTIAVTVNSINDAPVLTAPASTNGNEDTSITVAGISGADVDIGAGSARVTLGVTSGTLTLSSLTGLSFVTGANGSAAMSFTGSLSNINAALSNLTYSPVANYNGADTLAITLSDQGNTGAGGTLTHTKNITLNIAAVNDAPVVIVPGSQGVLHDTTLVINGTSVADVDLAAGEMQVTLSALHGTITLGSVAGLTFSTGDGTADASMVFSGTLASVNAALASISYLGNSNYSGSDTISVSANDQGFTGAGGAQGQTKTISINVAVAVGVTELLAE